MFAGTANIDLDQSGENTFKKVTKVCDLMPVRSHQYK
jgi:intein-encoded DNA endonuclease-like protein